MPRLSGDIPPPSPSLGLRSYWSPAIADRAVGARKPAGLGAAAARARPAGGRGRAAQAGVVPSAAHFSRTAASESHSRR
jgi:hypothetical protein